MVKYSIFAFSQTALVEKGLDLDDAMILNWFIDFYHTGRMTKVHHDGKEYAWVRYERIIEDLPILGINRTNNIARQFKKYVEKGIMERHISHFNGGSYSCYRFIPEAYEAILSREGEKYIKPKEIPPPPPKKEAPKSEPDARSGEPTRPNGRGQSPDQTGALARSDGTENSPTNNSPNKIQEREGTPPRSKKAPEYSEYQLDRIKLFHAIWQKRFALSPPPSSYPHIKSVVGICLPDEVVINSAIDECGTDIWAFLRKISQGYDEHTRGIRGRSGKKPSTHTIGIAEEYNKGF